MPSPSPWSALTEPEAHALMDLIREFKQPDGHGVSTEHFACILQSGPGPDAQPVERADLVGRLQRDLERAKDALVCRILHRDRWQAGIDRYYGHGLSVDFTCTLCDRRWSPWSLRVREYPR